MDLKAIQDRIHAINQTIAGVTAYRYFQQKFDSAELPALFFIPGRFQRENNQSGANQLEGTRTFTLFLVVFEWSAAIPTQTAQEKAEVLVGTIWDTYQSVKRLELDYAALTGVKGSTLVSDSGLVPYRFNTEQAAVEFTLNVTTHRSY